MSVALFERDAGVARDAGGNDRAGIARRVTSVLRAPLTTLLTRMAHVSHGHGCRKIHDDVIMGLVVHPIDPLRRSYLTIKHDAVLLQPGIHLYPIFRQMALKALQFGDLSSTENDAHRLQIWARPSALVYRLYNRDCISLWQWQLLARASDSSPRPSIPLYSS